MSNQVTEIKVDERGDETHESWLLIRANRVNSNPGASLFDSEILHQHFIRVSISRCTRRRDLGRDFKYNTKTVMEFDLSEAQWGAFVSSFGSGTGVPATLSYLLNERVPQAPFESRLNESHKEVREAGNDALSEIKESFENVMSAFEEGAGKKALRAQLHTLMHRINNAPSNMEFAAKSLTEHVENVVTKARADIEAMVLMGQENLLNSGESPLTLTKGNE